MFNVTVLKMKDIKKYLVGVMVTIIIVVCSTRYFSGLKDNNKGRLNETKYKVEGNEWQKKIKNKSKIISWLNSNKMVEETIPKVVNEENKQEYDRNEKSNNFEKILGTEIMTIGKVEEKQILEDGVIETNEEQKEESKEEIKDEDKQSQSKETQIVTQNPIQENYNIQYEDVKIKNQTDYTLTSEMLTPNISIENKNIILFHTHTCESYTPSEENQYLASGNYRTTDLNFSVARVGKELEDYLKKYNFNVVHDETYHDYPAYTGSYTRSLQTVENLLQKTSSDMIIDIHRDAVGSRSDYAPMVKIGEDYAAQMMFVIGTNDGGLWHPNWNQNLKFAIKVQKKANEKYPGLFKPIMLTKSRYNQHTGKFACIIEVGATGNKLEQCLCSMKYLSEILSEIVE